MLFEHDAAVSPHLHTLHSYASCMPMTFPLLISMNLLIFMIYDMEYSLLLTSSSLLLPCILSYRCRMHDDIPCLPAFY